MGNNPDGEFFRAFQHTATDHTVKITAQTVGEVCETNTGEFGRSLIRHDACDRLPPFQEGERVGHRWSGGENAADFMAEPVQLAQFRPDNDQFDRRGDGRPLLEWQGQKARIGEFLHHAALQVRQDAGGGLGAFSADEAGSIVRRVGPVADDIVISARCTLPDNPADLFDPVIGQDQFPGTLGLAAGFRDGGRGRQFQFHLEHVAIGRREELNRQGGGREETGHRQDHTGQKPDPGPCADRIEQAAIDRSKRAGPQAMTPETARRVDKVGIIEPGSKGADNGQGQNKG